MEPTDRYAFGSVHTARQLAASGVEPVFHRVRGTRAVFVRPGSGPRVRVAVWGQQAVDGGWVTAAAARSVAWRPSDSELAREERQIVDQAAQRAAMEDADFDHMVAGIYRDTVESIEEAPAVLADAVGDAAKRAALAAPWSTLALVAVAAAVAVVALR